jgi:hypothetical protein
MFWRGEARLSPGRARYRPGVRDLLFWESLKTFMAGINPAMNVIFRFEKQCD